MYTSGVTGPTSTTTPFGYGIPAYDATKPSPREDATTQSGVLITTGLGTTYTAADAAASFDEFLQAAEVIDASRAGGFLGA